MAPGRQSEQVVRRSSGEVLCDRCVVADSAFARMRGLLGRRGLRQGEGLLLRPASSIHTAYMRFSIDAVFLDRDGVVVKVVTNLRPWQAAAARRARAVLELAAGECKRYDLRAGERLALEPRPA